MKTTGKKSVQRAGRFSARPSSARRARSRKTDAPPASTEAVATEQQAAIAKKGTNGKSAADKAAPVAKGKGALDEYFPPQLKERWRTDAQEEQRENIRSAREAYIRRGLVLYLGAGVSCSAGLPTWWEMIRSLTVTMTSERVDEAMGVSRNQSDEDRAQSKLQIQEAVAEGAGADQSILMMARSVKNHFKERLAFEVAQTLYQPLAKTSERWWKFVTQTHNRDEQNLGSLREYAAIRDSPLFSAIVQLARAQRDVRGVQSIVNFNYDDLIEEWMRENGIRCDTLLSGQEPGREASLPCYHVHGVLPFRKLKDMRGADSLEMKPLVGNFVFSEDEYHTEYSDPYRWSNMTMINQLGRYSGLFIGLSLLDPNLRRIIDVTHRQYPDVKNYAILTRNAARRAVPQGKEPFLQDLFEKVETESFANIGVQVIWTDSYKEVPERILEICNIDD